MSREQAASFRDPSGFVFRSDGVLYRHVAAKGAADYDQLMSSGLYEGLVGAGLMVAHEEVEPVVSPGAHKVLRPNELEFVSYPYEWSFSQLRDAALVTLEAQALAMKHDMTLRDASAYNLLARPGGRPVLIDTLSFGAYEEGRPWVAYKQFCQHFLAPLALMAHTDVSLGNLMRVHIDGVPLALASRLLPKRTRLSPGLLAHIHLHAKSQTKHASSEKRTASMRMTRHAKLALLDSLESTIRGLAWKPEGTEWGDYYADTNYSDAAGEAKARLVESFIAKAQPGRVWDLGGNVGRFSRIASRKGIPTVCFDVDPAAVETAYRNSRDHAEECLLPLLMDLTNPSPSLGWHHGERDGLLARGPADLVMALALVHHLAISNNVPLARVAAFLAEASARHLIIEFVPKDDSQVERLLRNREDVFPHYDEPHFEAAFGPHFRIVEKRRVGDSKRTLYLMERC